MLIVVTVQKAPTTRRLWTLRGLRLLGVGLVITLIGGLIATFTKEYDAAAPFLWVGWLVLLAGLVLLIGVGLVAIATWGERRQDADS